MIDLEQLRDYVVKPVLLELDMYSKAAERLVIGTGLVESQMKYIHQISGPALGFWQMEPTTHDDIWENYILFRPDTAKAIARYTEQDYKNSKQLMWNMRYAAGMCRLHYRRVPSRLPHEDDIVGMAAYWKEFYNTSLGKGSETKFIRCAQDVLAL